MKVRLEFSMFTDPYYLLSLGLFFFEIFLPENLISKIQCIVFSFVDSKVVQSLCDIQDIRIVTEPCTLYIVNIYKRIT